ncbi:MAG: substrate-binding domain-containing protein [Bacteroidales bacterium]
MKSININKYFLLILFVPFLFSCTQNNEQIKIFHAGSLSMPFKTIADSFKVSHPNVDFIMEASGSIDCARKITELKKECDIMASADYTVIDKLLLPKYTDSNIVFAGNEMSIVYTKNSRYHDEINDQNWFKILLKPDVFYGRSDPNSDPCGYRSILVMKLAQQYYNNKSPFDINEFLAKDHRFIRPKEVDLIALLDSGALDYIFLYKSVAIQHGLPYLELPDEINLSNKEFANHYASVSVKVRGSSPKDSIIIKGTPMTYSLCILKNAPNKKLANEFVNFILDKNHGMKILKEMGQTPIYK